MSKCVKNTVPIVIMFLTFLLYGCTGPSIRAFSESLENDLGGLGNIAFYQIIFGDIELNCEKLKKNNKPQTKIDRCKNIVSGIENFIKRKQREQCTGNPVILLADTTLNITISASTETNGKVTLSPGTIQNILGFTSKTGNIVKWDFAPVSISGLPEKIFQKRLKAIPTDKVFAKIKVPVEGKKEGELLKTVLYRTARDRMVILNTIIGKQMGLYKNSRDLVKRISKVCKYKNK